MGEPEDQQQASDDQDTDKVRRAAGEKSADPQSEAKDKLRKAREQSLDNEDRARHGGNRANWTR